MIETTDSRPLPESFESFPLTRPEYISAMVHFYRGEMYRSQVWRMRLDTTTNWAVVTVAGMISFAFSSPDHGPLTLLLANILVTGFLWIEARRYRIFCVYRARVRMIEENFYLPLIRRSLVSPMDDWRDRVARDLDVPTFKNTQLEALLARLKRNYLWIYGILLVTWVARLFTHPTPAQDLAEVYSRTAVGAIPPSVVVSAMALFYLSMVIALFTPSSRHGVVEEISGLERELSH